METLSALLAAIPQPDVAGMARAQQHIDGLLKPPGSLGRLETLAVQLAGLPGLQGQLALAEKAIVVMCADPFALLLVFFFSIFMMLQYLYIIFISILIVCLNKYVICLWF